MNLSKIEEELIAERYVAGKLSAEEAARFEEYFVGCEESLSRIEDAERMQDGLRSLAEAEALRSIELGILGKLVARSRSRAVGWGLAAVLLILMALPTTLWLRQTGDLRRQLAEAQRPQVNTAIYALSPFRGAGSGEESPTHSLRWRSGTEWIVLSLEPGGETYPAYRATLFDEDQRARWQTDELTPDAFGALVINLHASFLNPGRYQLQIQGLREGAEPVPVARYPLRVLGVPPT